MNERVLQIPTSTARLVLQQLEAGGALTQTQLANGVGRTAGSVCKALKLLVELGYACHAGTKANRAGGRVGQPQLLFVHTKKALVLDRLSLDDDTSRAVARDLAQLWNGIIRRSIAEPRVSP
ncbi:MarR family transcriptional regulator [Paraburkholderia caribensis]|uniref:MarR family transcriptional regulator n=1 Tax=Paraburkholderia caribensis TaxID=75105 RepID=A0A9Q6RY19_9BURK|nr:MarR family transcriptional regulator [Paraburkholderia caribensis]MCO4881560.1 MarR family transcriptional regulator [Paraburkholderia caribensis]PTB24485.1 hypothetical protein C9I56_33520 [Paraburkholderia caribensis]QLB61612.1 hypothetical protein A9O66_03960 [Paraburkholderia caribensis]